MNELNRITPNTMWYTDIEGVTEPPAPPSEDGSQQEEAPASSGEEGGPSGPLAKISAVTEVKYLYLRGCTLIINGSNLLEQDFKEAIKEDNPYFESAEIRVRREQPDGNLTGFEILLKLRNPIRK